MRFECPHCQQPIEADDECAGMATNCPTCTENIVVPADAVITTQEVQLSPEADQFLAAACAEYDGKQQALDQDKWRLTSCMEWGFDDTTGAVTVRFEDGSAWEADGQFLGSFNPDDKTFQWAWDSPDMSEHLTRDSRLVKAIGERFGLRYLLMGGGCFPLPGTEFVGYLCSIALKATDSIGVMEAQAGGMIGFIMLKNPRWT